MTEEEKEAREKEKKREERKQRKADQQDRAKIRSDREKSYLKRKVIQESDTDEEEAVEAVNKEEVTDSDSEWEDEEEEKNTPEYNTIQLCNFSREVDRYKISNRAAAKLGNGILKDLKLVTKKNTRLLLCPRKVRQEREK